MLASNPGHREAIRFGKSSSLVMSFNPTAALRTYFSPEAILGATHRQAPGDGENPLALAGEVGRTLNPLPCSLSRRN
jgi:hypothetical protein